jgi:hypothetical protein
MDRELQERNKARLEYLEEQAHIWAFTTMGTFYWDNFLIGESYYNSKFKTKYNRRW